MLCIIRVSLFVGTPDWDSTMSEAAFSLLSLGLSFKGVKKSEQELFKKGSASSFLRLTC